MNAVEEMAREAAAMQHTTPEGGPDRRTVTSPANGRHGGRPSVTKQIADAFIQVQGDPFPIKKHRGQWYFYSGGVYRPITPDDLKGRIVKFLRESYPESATRTMIQNIVENLHAGDVAGVESLVKMPSWFSTGRGAAGWIPLQNRLVNVDTLARQMGGESIDAAEVSRPHSHDLFSRWGLPYAFEPGADCPKWRAFLADVQPEAQAREHLQMLSGLALVPDTSFNVFFVLYGEGGSGKSVFLHVLEKLVGPENVCAVPLTKFIEKHSIHPLTENLLNIVGDMPTSDGRAEREAEGVLKVAADGGMLACEPKGTNVYSAPATARCIFATNSLPTFADRSNAIWDRMRIVPFDVRIRGTEKQNPRLRHEIARAELPGVFLWAVEGLGMLRKLQQFPRGTKGEAVENQHRQDCDHERAFLQDRYETRNGSFLASGSIYSAYRAWCEENGYGKKSAANFMADLRRVFPGVVEERRRIGGDKVRGLRNLAPIADIPEDLGI